MDAPLHRLETRTFRWSDGVSTDGYQAVEISRGGLTWFRWSHVHGEGRIEQARQDLLPFLDAGPCRPCPKAIEDQLRTLARRWLE